MLQHLAKIKLEDDGSYVELNKVQCKDPNLRNDVLYTIRDNSHTGAYGVLLD